MKLAVILAVASAAFVAATPVAQPDADAQKAAAPLMKRACGDGTICGGFNNHGNCHLHCRSECGKSGGRCGGFLWQTCQCYSK